MITTSLAKQALIPLQPLPLHHALCTFIITLLVFACVDYFPISQVSIFQGSISHIPISHTSISQASWLILSSLLLSQAGLRMELKVHQIWPVFFYLLYGLLAAVGVVVMSLYRNFGLIMVVIFFTTTLTGYAAGFKRTYFFAAWVINLLFILAAFSPVGFGLALQRGYLIVIGSFLVFIPRLLFFLYQRPRKLFYIRAIFYHRLKAVYQLIFYSLGLSPRFLKFEREESHFQMAWRNGLAALQLLKTNLADSDPQVDLTREAEITHLNQIWDITMSLASLRYRLRDDSVLKMGQNELQAIWQMLSLIWDVLAQGNEKNLISPYLDRLQIAIQGLESFYQSTLQTVTQEPLVLVLFIQDLYALKEKLEL